MSRHPLDWFSQFPSRWIPSWLPISLDDESFFSNDELSVKGSKIYEENNQLHVEVPLPGLNPEDIEVSLNKGTLWIKGEAKEEEKDKKKKYYRSSKRQYAYSLVLPSQIDEKQEPQAVYENGILKVSLQLAKPAETKKIQVKAKSGKK